ncbi:nicotinate phosphoribosyltransferase [Ancylostoma duodenale]|uniref:Nicotinate phosphoribosyltransferase n=1 Tax=Ancylostoma duodenale TaxID=51022 RepID=A0A0C2H5F7_9BILA|nr:nicotinate phosphoribosyltransferase [Ancylostoma duodenale]
MDGYFCSISHLFIFCIPERNSSQISSSGLHVNGQDSLVQPLLTDYYQITMCYAYWLAGSHEENSVFDLFFRCRSQLFQSSGSDCQVNLSFCRKNPFNGEFTVFAGLEDCLRFVENFKFSKSDIEYIKSLLPANCNPDFFEYLAQLDCRRMKIEAVPEGSVVFPKVPLMTVEGPLAICQLMETTFLNLVNYASLIATNAARFRQVPYVPEIWVGLIYLVLNSGHRYPQISGNSSEHPLPSVASSFWVRVHMHIVSKSNSLQVAGDKMQMLEFGLRRAQGPNGGLTASKYCYIGGIPSSQIFIYFLAIRYCSSGFDGTSNVLAGKLFGIPVKGTQAHSFVCSFSSANDLRIRSLKSRDGTTECDLYSLSEEKRRWIMEKIDWGVVESEVSEGELAAFVAYAIAFPSSNMSLIDTYDVLRSGVINFVAVTLALFDLGYKSIGCRIDSGDLSYLSKEVRARFGKVAELYVSLVLRSPRTLAYSRHPSLDWIQSLTIVASNDINEETIMSLNEQSHEIDAFGVGTHLVTCQKQPALGCVYKDRVSQSLRTVRKDHRRSLNPTPYKVLIFVLCFNSLFGKVSKFTSL